MIIAPLSTLSYAHKENRSIQTMEDLRNYINGIRRDFSSKPLNNSDISDDPFRQYEIWFTEAVDAQVLDPYAMVLSTVSEIGFPSSRVVYMRDISTDGLVFYTNFNSQKGKEILNNNYVSLLFFWGELERQIRVMGQAEKVTDAVSDAYFASRPRESQLGAWASAQSHEIPSREELEERLAYYDEKFSGLNVPRPENWGGYLVRPSRFEFWQGRPSRLHDRLVYVKDGEAGWNISRLAP